MPKLINFKDFNIDDNCVISFGNYDGVHLGHQNCINHLIEIADNHNMKSLLMIFNPHTLNIINPDLKNYSITDHSTKVELLMRTKLDYLVVLDFDIKKSKYTASHFIERIITKLNPKKILIGYDSFFGFNKEGDFNYLENYYSNTNIDVVELPVYRAEKSTAVKSSVVRKYLNEGSINKTTDLLGRYFKLSGKVVKGNSVGRIIGFPTANLEVDSNRLLVPMDGVYVTKTLHKDKKYNSLSNIGFRPTFSSSITNKTIESYLLTEDNLDIYGEIISIEFIDFIRKEKKFNTSEELVNQINIDLKKVKNRS